MWKHTSLKNFVEEVLNTYQVCDIRGEKNLKYIT